MATRTLSLKLGLAFAGLTLKAQPVDAQGNPQGSAVTTGFADIGDGEYFWSVDSIYDLFVIRNAATNAKLTIASLDDSSSDTAIPISVSITPIASTVISPNVDEKEIILYQDTATVLSFTAVDGDGDALTLDGHDMRFLVLDDFIDTESVIFTIETAAMEIEGGTVSIPIPLSQTATPGRHLFALRDLTANTVISTGVFEIRALPGGN